MTAKTSHQHFCVEECVFRRVYVTRYALTHEKNPAFEALPGLGKEGGLVTDFAASGPMWQFAYTLRALRPAGWVHVYEEELDLWQPYRTPKDYAAGPEPFFVPVHKDATHVYMAYSETKWPQAYWDQLKADGSYKTRMQRIELTTPGTRHTAPMEQYTQLVEEFREKPGKLLSLRHLMADKVFQPVSLDYQEGEAGQESEAGQEGEADQEAKAKEAKARLVGERWQNSANPFGITDENLYAPKSEQKEFFPLPRPFTPDAAADPAPVLAALADPLGEGRDLAVIHCNNMEDVQLYTGYYGYTYLLGKMFVSLEKQTEQKFTLVDPDSYDESSPEDFSTITVTTSLVEQAIPGRPWIAFLHAQEAMRGEFKKLLQEYIGCWRRWLLAPEAPHTFFWALRDYTFAGAGPDVLTGGRKAFACCHAWMDSSLPDAESIQGLFADETWKTYFKRFLALGTACDEYANMLVSLLAKAGLTSSPRQYKDLIDHATAFVRGQPNVLPYQGEGQTVRHFMEHTLVFHDAEDEAAGQDADEAKEGQEAEDARFKALWEEDSKGREWLRWDVQSAVLIHYGHNPPSIHGLSVFDVAAHVRNRSLCNALSTLNALNMWVGNAILFSTGFITLVQGLKEGDEFKTADGMTSTVASIADYAAFRIIQSNSLPQVGNLSKAANASRNALGSTAGSMSTTKGMMAASRYLTVHIARVLLGLAWAITAFKDMHEDFKKGHKEGLILGATGTLLGLIAFFTAGWTLPLVLGLLSLGAWFMRAWANSKAELKKLLEDSYWGLLEPPIKAFSFRLFRENGWSYYAPFETFPPVMNVARFAHLQQLFDKLAPVNVRVFFEPDRPAPMPQSAAPEMLPVNTNLPMRPTRVEVELSKLFVSMEEAKVTVLERWDDEPKPYPHVVIRKHVGPPRVSDNEEKVKFEFWLYEEMLMLDNLLTRQRKGSGKYMVFTIEVVYLNAHTRQKETYSVSYRYMRPIYFTPDFVEKKRGTLLTGKE